MNGQAPRWQVAPLCNPMGRGGGGGVFLSVQSQHMKWRLYLLCQRQTENDRWVQAAAPTRDCNYLDKSRWEHSLTEDSDRVGWSHTWHETSAASAVNTNPSESRFACLCLCVEALRVNGKFPLWSSTVPVCSPSAYACRLVSHRRVDKATRHRRESFADLDCSLQALYLPLWTIHQILHRFTESF